MSVKIRAFLWFLTAICFAYDFYLWGGLRNTPLIGAQLMEEAPFDSPLASSYLFIGNRVVATFGHREEAREFAARRFPELVANPAEVEHLAVRRFLAAQSFWGTLCYYLGPVLLALSLVLHVMRQKRIRSLGAPD
jgi:hypothetical protein